MTKQQFESQHYYLKWICAFPLLAVALLIEFFIAQHINSDILFYISCAVIMGGLLSAYYFVTDRLHLFQFKGYFWEEADHLVIALGKKQYEVGEVKTLFAGEPDIFLYQYAYLLIETPNQKIKIFGQTLHGDMKFSDSELYPLFQMILEKNKDLKPKKIFDADVEGWYQK